MRALERPETIPIPKRKVKAFIRELEQNGAGEWRSYGEKNNRGDYGYDEHFFLNGKFSHTISIDGARQDVRFYRARK
ncbi:MAG: hypothetical protein WC373_04700 [Smithella sp.]|jgi:hypothetical protein